jgi:hypothetical protein
LTLAITDAAACPSGFRCTSSNVAVVDVVMT